MSGMQLSAIQNPVCSALRLGKTDNHLNKISMSKCFHGSLAKITFMLICLGCSTSSGGDRVFTFHIKILGGLPHTILGAFDF